MISPEQTYRTIGGDDPVGPTSRPAAAHRARCARARKNQRRSFARRLSRLGRRTQNVRRALRKITRSARRPSRSRERILYTEGCKTLRRLGRHSRTPRKTLGLRLPKLDPDDQQRPAPADEHAVDHRDSAGNAGRPLAPSRHWGIVLAQSRQFGAFTFDAIVEGDRDSLRHGKAAGDQATTTETHLK